MKYYLISYAWRRIPESTWRFDNIVTDQHPTEWLYGTKKYDSETYTLLNFVEIDRAAYLMLRGIL